MTRKHFIKAANRIREYVDNGKLMEAHAMYSMIVDIQDNPLFDTAKFRKACGL